eukprot:CAMPEP_0206210422 /NCGR_PEP_ID=MMETSP0166-20121206/17525_1 /ASSEMBLY_ACC=CAM_ASM_000260 /TAXON_ID=95228 /ORGANISM="Vannella robusta, Strain DIVA3 518/3/11/1/6" /LENGTH=456 /DNA_ID=CAMNT_0053632067 /DNA_START=618 /DNA_END=1985 /DNA_ORIENTATION=+
MSLLEAALGDLLDFTGFEGNREAVAFIADDASCFNEEKYWRTEDYLSIAAGAALGAVGTVAADFDLFRFKKDSGIHFDVDLKHCAASLNSHKYSRANGKAHGKLWDEFSGFYRCSDSRWIQLHCNYPHHRRNVLDALGLPESASRKDVESEIYQNTAEHWENELTSKDCCVSFVRTVCEWRKHPQFIAISALPLLDITKIGESPAELGATSDTAFPLSGIKVLDLSRVLAGPVGCKLMAQLGADVLKIVAEHLPYVHSLVPDTNIGKRSTFIDIRTPAGKSKLLELVKQSDVFFQAYRPGALAQKGFSPEELALIRPGIIYVSLSAYSHEGIWSFKRGFDSLVQSATGIVDTQSKYEGLEATDVPVHWPVSAQDYICGFLSAFATISALKRRAVDGGSYHVRISLSQTGHWISSLGRSPFTPDKALEENDIRAFLDTIQSEWGLLQYLKPVLQIPG